MNRRTSSLSHRRQNAVLPPIEDALATASEPTALRYNECQEAVEKLTEFLSHELTTGQQDELQTHLHECRGCFAKFHFEEALLQTIRERAQQVVTPAPLRARILELLDAETALV